MVTERILVVDDDADMRSTCRKFLRREGYDTAEADRAEAALALYEAQAFDLVLTDLKMPSMDGMELLQKLREMDSAANVVVFTGFGTVEDAVTAIKNGAFDFISKPFTPDHLLITVQRALKHRSLERENRALHQQLDSTYGFDNIIGKSAPMRRMFDMVRKIANTQANVLITGESGTGKELIARSVHANSARKSRPLVPLNCGGLPEHLVESELFGHEKGAFTGAASSRAGLIEHADGGTFFLDEISELPLNLQVKLLRVLEERTIRRVGSNREVAIDIRLISATNRNLEQMVADGTFREDLYYRVNTFIIDVPPLRTRTEDIPLLANHFLKHYAGGGGERLSLISDEAMDVLARYPWPGNVRELQHVIERAVALAGQEGIRTADLPDALRHGPTATGSRDLSHRLEMPFKEAKDDVIDEFERAYIRHLLSRNGGNISRAAEQSGIDRRSLHRLLVKHDIDASSFSG